MTTPLYPADFGAAKPPAKRPRKNRRMVTVPERVGPRVKLVFSEMARQGFTYDQTEEGSGVRRATIKAWRKKNAPGLESIEAVLGFLGWGFVPVPSLQALPPAFAGDLTALALRANSDIPTTFAALVAVGVEQALVNMTIAEKRAVVEARAAGYAANDNIKRRRASGL